MRFLIFRQSSLGDVILISPVLKRLRESFPDSTIDILTKKQYASLYAADSRVEAVHSFGGDWDFILRGISLRAKKYDCLIDLQLNFRSHILSTLLAPVSVLRYNKRRLARNAVVRYPGKKLSVNHSIEAYLESLRPLGIQSELLPPEIQFDQALNRDIANRLGNIGSFDPLIAICPGAKHFEKRWPAEKYADSVRILLENEKVGILVISSRGDGVEPDLGITHPRLFAARDWDLPSLAALMSRCRLALTNDSGLMHLAESVGTPVLAIFGPTNPRLGFAPTLTNSRILCDDVSCSPCSVHGKKPCYQPEKYCFKEITPTRVVGDIKAMLPVI